MSWVYLKDKKPIVYISGNFDGLCSDKVLVKTKNGKKLVADLNEGILDGEFFSIWYNILDLEIEEEIIAWMQIPE